MEKFLSLPPVERGVALREAGEKSGLAPASVEKDFWVCFMLREAFRLEGAGDGLTFKGGTSLSKAWGLINRFSEDIDLTIARDLLGQGGAEGPDQAPSRKQQKRRLEALREACRGYVAGPVRMALHGRLEAQLGAAGLWSLALDPDDPDAQTLLFAYPREAGAKIPTYVTSAVKLEFGARSDPWPSEERWVTPIVAEAFPDLFDAPVVTVRALRPERTFWEKVMLLHEERFRPAGRTRRPRMARHYYDIWRLIEAGVATAAAADQNLFGQVAAHRELYFRHSWVDYATLVKGTIAMTPHPEQLDEWRQDYQAMRGEMFLDEPPPFDEILVRIESFQSEFNAA